jgi:hypothetical protein
MKNAPNLELSRLARQWGATAVPFGELCAEGWLETSARQRALNWHPIEAALIELGSTVPLIVLDDAQHLA